MGAVIRIVGSIHGTPTSVDGQYLKTYDPDAHGGRGMVTGTSDLARARRFPDKVTAWSLWTTTSRKFPTRPDGKPNRPLTAFTILVEEVPDD